MVSPQFWPATAQASSGATQPHLPGVLLPHVSEPAQPQTTTTPQALVTLPQSTLLQGDGAVQLQVPLLHVFGEVQPQETALPQLSVRVPQLTPLQGVPLGVHPQVFAAPPPPQLLGGVQVLPQSTVVPQLLVVTPHATFAQVVALASGTHAQRVGAPEQLSPAAHAVQRAGSAQPLVASVGTQLDAQSLVPAPQLPITQAPPLQTNVPLAGQPVLSQVVAPHP